MIYEARDLQHAGDRADVRRIEADVGRHARRRSRRRRVSARETRVGHVASLVRALRIELSGRLELSREK